MDESYIYFVVFVIILIPAILLPCMYYYRKKRGLLLETVQDHRPVSQKVWAFVSVAALLLIVIIIRVLTQAIVTGR